MKNQFRFITAFAVTLACCAPLATNAAPKKSASPSPSPMASATPKTKASPTPKATTSPAKTTSSPAPKTTTTDAGKTTTDPNKARAIPFHGTISTVDNRAKTFTIAGKEHSRTFRITDKTTMTKAGQPATMKDVVANEEVRGSYWKVMDGTLEAKTVKLGPKTDAEKAADEKRKMRKKEKESAEPSPSPTP